MIVESITNGMEELSLGMTNYDGSIDEGFAVALMKRPGEVCGTHSARNFHGTVFYKDGKFHEEVWVHKEVKEIVSASSLMELMNLVSAKYGWE